MVNVDDTPLANLLLSQHQVDRAIRYRDDEKWLAKRWSDPETAVLLVADGRVPVDPGPRLGWRSPSDDAVGELYLLGVDAMGRAHFALRVDSLPADQSSADLRQLAGVLPADQTALLVHAVALANWHATHQFCPRCGAPTQVEQSGAERRCATDGSSHFPRIDPAVIVLVTDPLDRALLGRQDSWPAGRFSTLAGFVEPGESAEQAVAREVLEESGLSVHDIRYAGAQPWPFPASLMLGYFATSDPGSPVADGVELAEVRWFTRADLAAGIQSGDVIAPSGISIARRLVERWYGEPFPSAPPGVGWR